MLIENDKYFKNDYINKKYDDKRNNYGNKKYDSNNYQ